MAVQKAAESLAENRPVKTMFYTNAYREMLSRGLFTEIPLELRKEVESLYQILTYLNDMRRAQALKIYDTRNYLKADDLKRLVSAIRYIRISLKTLWKIKEQC